MKKLLIVLFLLPLMVIGQEPENLVHNSKTYVDDYADIFTSQQEMELDGIIRKFFDTTQISLVTIKSFNGIEPNDYTVRLGRKWGVGGKSNNGLLIVIGVNDHKMYAATGGGIEGDLPDMLVVELQYQYAIPRFKENKYFEGTRDLLKAYINQLSPSAKALREKERQVQQQRRAEQWENTKEFMLYIFGILGIICLIGLPFYLKWRKKMKIKRAEEEEQERILQEKMYRERPAYVAPVFVPIYHSPSQSSSSRSNDDDNSYSRRSSDDSYSSGSSSSSSDSSSSDFGGGSFSGGGGGSSW